MRPLMRPAILVALAVALLAGAGCSALELNRGNRRLQFSQSVVESDDVVVFVPTVGLDDVLAVVAHQAQPPRHIRIVRHDDAAFT